ncbi:hypothetical protein F0562_020196 [Nyssa sinensis]|uniref:Major facilitator superfamily (MFS) profile domain-containing protein n=1 Tax=Nyssa sinensis TaxID=561372 RepID=A0A5J5BV10_9ASTE|nr:hypothetical protein F0562_020196 [Nyssa sinensis]
MGIAAVGNNLITYVINEMHFPLSNSANIVTNFIGTIFILALFGGYLSDSYLGCFWTMLIFGFVELSGFILLSVQAHLPQLKPPKCNMFGSKLILGWTSALEFRPAAMAMGLISMVCGTLVYRNKPPQGSIFTPIAQVFVAAILKRKQVCPSDPQMLHGSQTKMPDSNLAMSSNADALLHTERFRCLDKACIKIQDGSNTRESPWRLCTMTQVEQVKILLSVIPIFACTIVFNTILAQLQTFSVQQGSSMNTQLTKNFHIPPASLQSIPYILLIFVVPLYDTFFVPFARKFTGHESGITPLQRIGFGLFVRHLFHGISCPYGEQEKEFSIGLIEFFYKQSLKGMQSFLTAMTYCSYSFGFYLSSVLVSLVNKITSHSSSGGWLIDNDLNKDRLDLFYWLLAVLSFVNFINYLFWAKWYNSNPSVAVTPQHDDSKGEEINQYSLHSSKTNGVVTMP